MNEKFSWQEFKRLKKLLRDIEQCPSKEGGLGTLGFASLADLKGEVKKLSRWRNWMFFEWYFFSIMLLLLILLSHLVGKSATIIIVMALTILGYQLMLNLRE